MSNASQPKSPNMIKYPVVLYFALITFLSLTLSACEGIFGDIDEKESRPFARDIGVGSNHDLRIYQDGDFITYSVFGEDLRNLNPDNNFTGTLTVQWDEHFVTQPPYLNGGAVLTLLKETSTLDLDGGSTYTSIRYISQDSDDMSATKGTVSVHAYHDPLAGNPPSSFYWVNTEDPLGTITLTLLAPKEVLISPLVQVAATATDNFTYNIMAGCDDAAGCDLRSQHMNEYHDYQDISDLVFNTELGQFINLSEIIITQQIPDDPVEPPLPQSPPPPTLVDIAGFCDPIHANPSINKRVWLHPEIGIVRMVASCFSTTEEKRITATIRNTNIRLPCFDGDFYDESSMSCQPKPPPPPP